MAGTKILGLTESTTPVGTMAIGIADSPTTNKYITITNLTKIWIQDIDASDYDLLQLGNITSGADNIHNWDISRDANLADSTEIGSLRFRSYDGGAVLVNYARIEGVMRSDVTANEDGHLNFYVSSVAGVETLALSIEGTINEAQHNFQDTRLTNVQGIESASPNTATGNFISMANDTDWISWRNVANTGNINLFVNTNNDFEFTSGIDMSGGHVINTDYLELYYGTPATSGDLRFGATGNLQWRNVGNTNNNRFDMATDLFRFQHDGVVEYTFGATEADFLGNNIRNFGFLELNKITAPANPSAEDSRLYFKEETTANNGLYLKGQKNSSIVEQKISNIQDFSKVFFNQTPTQVFYSSYIGGLSSPTEELVRAPAKFGGRLRWLRSHTNTNSLSTAITTVALRINGVNQLSFTIGAGVSTDQEDDNISAPIEFSAGDDITSMMSIEAGGTGFLDLTVYWQIEWDITS